MTTALIIGGGIAGAVSAMALGKAGLDSTVYEAYPTGADDIGAFLTIMSNGLDALRAVGLEQQITDVSFAASTVTVFDREGRELEQRPLVGARTLTRAGLYRALHDELLRRGGSIEHGKRLVTASPTSSGGVRAVFQDGSTAEGDLLVGADGIHSTVRGLIDSGAPKPRYANLNIFYGFTNPAKSRQTPSSAEPLPRKPESRDCGRIGNERHSASGTSFPTAPEGYRMIFGSQAFFGYTTAPDGETWWFARLSGEELTAAELEALTPAYCRERVLEAVVGDATPAADIVRATGDRIDCRNAYDIPSTPRWHTSSLVLTGDAAHAASPAAGQGASMALEDAVVLGKCLRDIPATERAFQAYVHLRRERTEALVEASAKLGDAAASGPRATAKRPDWVRAHHIDWNEPVTEPGQAPRSEPAG